MADAKVALTTTKERTMKVASMQSWKMRLNGWNCWKGVAEVILIKGMEMPKDDEVLNISIYPDGKVSIDFDLKCTKIAEAVEFPSRWIPVSKRLPEKRKWVLCFCEANIIDVLRYENAEWYHDPTHVYMFEFVTHWMPLPEPPKEE